MATAGDDDERHRRRWHDSGNGGVDEAFFASFLWCFHGCFGVVLKVKWCRFGDKIGAIFWEKWCCFGYCLAAVLGASCWD